MKNEFEKMIAYIKGILTENDGRYSFVVVHRNGCTDCSQMPEIENEYGDMASVEELELEDGKVSVRLKSEWDITNENLEELTYADVFAIYNTMRYQIGTQRLKEVEIGGNIFWYREVIDTDTNKPLWFASTDYVPMETDEFGEPTDPYKEFDDKVAYYVSENELLYSTDKELLELIG